MSEPLVILPGLMCDGRMFGAQIEALAAQVIDGFYGGADSIGAMADYALARAPGRFALMGHSMGARVALEVWRRAPARVARLALADTGVHGVKPGEADKRYGLRDLGRAEGFDALVDAWLPPMIGPVHRENPRLYGDLRAMVLDAGQAVYEAQIAALLGRPDAEAVVATVRCPLFAIVGADDAWSPVAQHEAIVAAVPGAELRVIAGAGHMAPAEAPEAFNAALAAWLKKAG